MHLGMDVGRNSISPGVPPSWQLASDEAAEQNSLQNEDVRTLLDKPFTGWVVTFEELRF